MNTIKDDCKPDSWKPNTTFSAESLRADWDAVKAQYRAQLEREAKGELPTIFLSPKDFERYGRPRTLNDLWENAQLEPANEESKP